MDFSSRLPPVWTGEMLGWILDLWVISSTPATQCNLWEYGHFVFLFFSEATLEPCTMWTKWQRMFEEPTFWSTHQRISKISISGSRSKIALILLGFLRVLHWARMCTHDRKCVCTQFTVAYFNCLNHSNTTDSPPRLSFSAAFGTLSKASKTGCILRTT